MRWIDVHCHYEDDRFNEDREEVLSSLPSFGVLRTIDAGCTTEDSERIKEYAEKYEHLYFCAGVHPEKADTLTDENLQKLRALWQHEKCVGVGEIGLDYHWPENPDKNIQQETLRRLLAEAKACGLPAVLHTRDALGDMLTIIREEQVDNALMHCFSESRETARELLDRGLYFSFGGTATFKNARKAVENLQYIPRDRILLETDSPYLAPEPVRGTRNDSRNIAHIITFIAALWGMSPDAVADLTTENAKRFFPKMR